jgi:nucleolar protein 53
MAPTKSAKASSSKTQQPTTKSVAKGKSKAVVGAPSQPGQKTRKGKKAWRKNIDIADEEVAMEEAREEERLTG